MRVASQQFGTQKFTKFVVFIALFFCQILLAQPPINNPTNYNVCDDNNDGFSIFNLTSKNAEILGSLSPVDYTVSYHLTVTDAQIGANSLPNSYANNTPYSETVYVRVQENANPSNFATTVLNLVVTNAPNAGTISGNRYPMCTSGTTTLTSTVAGGTWSSSNSGVATVDSSTGVVVPTSPGTVTISHTVIGTGGCPNAVATYIVYTGTPNAGTLLGNQNVCVGGTSTFTTTGDISGTWSSSNTSIATVDANTGVITGMALGTATITYTIPAVGSCTSTTATRTVTVGTNCPPVANDDSGITPEDTSVYFTVLANDTDSEGLVNPTTVTVFNQPAHGTFVVSPVTGDIIYTPDPNFCGIDSLEYSVCDNGSPSLCDTAIVTITVTCVNDAPVANDDIVFTPLIENGDIGIVNILTNDTDADGNPTPSSGHIVDLDPSMPGNQITFTDFNGGDWTYDPATGNVEYNPAINYSGPAQITYELCDSGAPVLCDTAIIQFSIIPVEDVQIQMEGTYIDTNLDGITNPGDQILYNINIINNSTSSINNITVSCSNAIVSGGTIATLAAGVIDTSTFTATYTLTATDIAAAQVQNSATLNCTEFSNITSTDTTPCTSCNISSGCTSCTYTPINRLSTGETNIITGTVILDSNNNGCTTTDPRCAYLKMRMTYGSETIETFTNAQGVYTFYAGIGTFTVAPDLSNTNFSNANPTSQTFSFAQNDAQTHTQDFCIVVPSITDVQVLLYPTTTARPGFQATYVLRIYNNGNTTVSMSNGISFSYDDDRMNFVSSSVTPSTSSTGLLQWDYLNLAPGQITLIYITMLINSPSSSVPVNIGNILPYSATVLPVSGDSVPTNNTYNFNQTVVGSYDPNIITCLEGNNLPVSEIGNYLHYVVDFENTGNFPAEFIIVKIPIDNTDYDLSTIQLLNTSHTSYAIVENGNMIIYFPNIMLDTGGHGNVLLKIKSKNTLQAGDMVSKRADIYFDYNAPVDTGFTNTVYQSLASQIFELDNTITLYPNPTKGILNIKASSNIQKAEVFDIQGRLIMQQITNLDIATLDISNYSNGVYFVKVTTQNGSKVEKIIKE